MPMGMKGMQSPSPKTGGMSAVWVVLAAQAGLYVARAENNTTAFSFGCINVFVRWFYLKLVFPAQQTVVKTPIAIPSLSTYV